MCALLRVNLTCGGVSGAKASSTSISSKMALDSTSDSLISSRDCAREDVKVSGSGTCGPASG